MIITIDGYCCQGKSTVARMLARELGYEFFSIGTVFRFLALTYHALAGRGQERRAKEALAIMEKTPIEGMATDVKSAEVDRALSVLSGYPFVHERIAEKILRYAEGKKLILDGRIGFLLFPDAYRNYYFKTSLAKRAWNASRSRGLTYDEAVAYIKFRDSFEIGYEIPPTVKTVELDGFESVLDIVAYLKEDIQTM